MKLIRLLLAASAAFFYVGTASAQNSGTVTSNAFAIGKGPGQAGFTSFLLGNGQIPIGQTGAAPNSTALSGDVTMSAAGVTAIGSLKILNGMIANNAVSLAKLATMTNNRALCNVTGGASIPVECTPTQLTTLVNTFTTTLSGAVPAPGTVASKFLRDDGTWQTVAGAGTVTNVAAGYGLTASPSPITTTGTLTVALTDAYNSIPSDIPMPASSTTGGPGVTIAAGRWLFSSTITILSSSTIGQAACYISDGTNVVGSSQVPLPTAAAIAANITITGIITTAGATFQTFCTNNAAAMTMKATTPISGIVKASSISAVRIQ